MDTFAMAFGCGLIARGIHAVLLARALGILPIVMDYTHRSNSGAGASGEAAVVAQHREIRGWVPEAGNLQRARFRPSVVASVRELFSPCQ